MKIRDRIKELRRVRADTLIPNAKNWRRHPAAQKAALQGVLDEVGYADALLARELPGGSLELIDGHLRAETTPDQMVPVLILDVDEAEAAKLLVSLDPLAAMAEADSDKLDELLREIDTGSEALQQMMAELATDAGLYAGELEEGWGGTEDNKTDQPKNVVCYVGMDVGVLDDFEKTIAACAIPGESKVQTILRALDAIHT